MTTFDYDEKLKKIERKYREDIKILKEIYSKANNPYKIGDIISDHAHIIKIDKISFSYVPFIGHYPVCVYEGFILTKKGILNKKMVRKKIWQNNIILENKIKDE